jgi:hypothetical protein
MPGPLTQSPLSGGFWNAMIGGLRDSVASPVVRDVRQGHRALKEAYPLAYQAAQMHPAVGIPAAGMDYADAFAAGDTGGMVRASLSSIPVMDGAFRVASTAPRSLAQAARTTAAQHGLRLPTWMGGVYKTGAAESVTEMGESAHDQTRQWMGPQ